MMRKHDLIVLMALAMVFPTLPVHAASDDDRYTIMKPEPWLAPKYQSPRGTRQRVKTPKPAPSPAPARRTQVPPPMHVPETGRVLPNLPSAGSGRGGAETVQDRSVRCAHQSGVHGPAATGSPGSYIRGCINQ
jgi:hypothetical protein